MEQFQYKEQLSSAKMNTLVGELNDNTVKLFELEVQKEVEAEAIAKLRDDLVLMGDKVDALDASFGDVNVLLDDLIENP